MDVGAGVRVVGRACSPAPASSHGHGHGHGKSKSKSKSLHPVGWQGGSGCGGRCKYIHVSSVAASMRLTPPQPDPPRLRQISAICWNLQLLVPAAVGGCRPRFYSGGCRPLVGTERSDRLLLLIFFFLFRGWTRTETVRGRAGWVAQDRWRHGWRHRAPKGEGALLAKHCFASARTHSRQRLGRTPEGGLRRVLRNPPRPTHSQCQSTNSRLHQPPATRGSAVGRKPPQSSAETVRPDAHSRNAATCSAINTDNGRVARISVISSSVSSGRPSACAE